MPALAILVLIAWLVTGSGLAGLPSHDRTTRARDFGGLPEGLTSRSTFDLWPFGLRCEYHGSAGERRSESCQASRGEQLAWIAVAALLGGFALRMRATAVVRGAAEAAALLAVAGAIWQSVGFQIAWAGAYVAYPPLAFGLDVLLLPREQRSFAASALTAVALVATVMAILILVLFNAYAAIAVGVLAGAAIGAGVERWRVSRGDLLPSH